MFRKKDPLLIHKGEGSTYETINKSFSKSSFEHTW
jgi:hypothetical protein